MNLKAQEPGVCQMPNRTPTLNNLASLFTQELRLSDVGVGLPQNHDVGAEFKSILFHKAHLFYLEKMYNGFIIFNISSQPVDVSRNPSAGVDFMFGQPEMPSLTAPTLQQLFMMDDNKENVQPQHRSNVTGSGSTLENIGIYL